MQNELVGCYYYDGRRVRITKHVEHVGVDVELDLDESLQ